MTRWKCEAQVAVEAVRQAAVVCRAIQKQLIPDQAVAKEDKSPVTAADFASQAVVCGRLTQAFPQDPIVGEEAAAVLRSAEKKELRQLILQQVGVAMGTPCQEQEVLGWIDRGQHAGSSDRFWTLDPIDGTKGFLRKGQYAIALALIEQGRLVVGALGCPELPDGQGNIGTLLLATADAGVQRLSLQVGQPPESSQAARVSTIGDLKQARICESVESGHTDQDASSLIMQELGLTQPGVRMDSQAKYAVVARGDAEIYLRLPRSRSYREKIWDHGAGAISVLQAGGKVTDIEGKPLDFSRGRELAHNLGVIATNGLIHDQVLAAVRKHVKV